jgi:hypothetical protein
MNPGENRILDIRVMQRDRWQMNGGDVYRYVTFDEISIDPSPKNWLIKGIFALGETSAWIGPPGSLKSALLAEASIAVAGGLDWHAHRSKRAMGVVYFALERADLVNRRLVAHKKKLGLGSLPIVVSNAVLDLTKEDSWKKAVNTIRDVETRLGAEVGAIIIDTHSKLVAAGGGDENSAKDQNIIFANIARVKLNTGVHVALIGHTGKDESRGARGSNALLGDVDVMVNIAGDLVKTATVTKANDAPEGPLFSFKSEVYEFGKDEDGDAITVNIVSSEEISSQSATVFREPKLTPNQRIMYRILRDAGAAGLSQEEWYDKAKSEGIGLKAPARLTEIRYALCNAHLIHEYSGRASTVRRK